MTRSEEFDGYRRLMGAATPDNPRRELDIQASLRAFDAAQTGQKRRFLPEWLRLPVLVSASAAVAAALVAVAYLPSAVQEPAITAVAPPDLRLALPADPPAAAARDAAILAAFTPDLPQYFPLPWDRGAVLAVLGGIEAGSAEKVLFAAEGRRLVVTPRTPEISGSRGHEDGYQRFAIALAGLALLASGEDLGPDWTEPTLSAEARSVVNGLPIREAAFAAVTAR